MKNTRLLTGLLILPALFAGGCHDASSPESTHTIRGSVMLIDTNGMTISDRSNVRVSPEGSNQSVQTDSLGRFTLQNIPVGSTPVIFSKPGFAELHIISKIPDTVFLAQISHLSPDLVTRPFAECFVRYNFRDTQVYSKEAGGIIRYWVYDSLYEPLGLAEYSCRIADAPNYFGRYSASIRIYFGTRDSISPLDPTSFRYFSQPISVDSKDASATYELYRDSLFHNGFAKDEKIYCVAFACGAYTQYQSYTDPSTGQKIYTGFSPLHSEVKEFILP